MGQFTSIGLLNPPDAIASARPVSVVLPLGIIIVIVNLLVILGLIIIS